MHTLTNTDHLRLAELAAVLAEIHAGAHNWDAFDAFLAESYNHRADAEGDLYTDSYED